MTEKYLLQELSRYSLGTFADILYRNSILYPDYEAFVWGEERVSFKQFNERVNVLLHGLQALGIQKGDIIGILTWNRIEYPIVFGAAMKGGFILAHYNPRQKAEELVYVINDSEPKALFIEEEFCGIIKSVQKQLSNTEIILTFGDQKGDFKAYSDLVKDQSNAEPDPIVTEEDPLTIFYTSGTTGVPRGAIYEHKQKVKNAVLKALNIGLELGDRHLVVLPMFHIGGDSHIWPFFIKGGCNVITPRHSFDPAVSLQMIKDEEITDLHIVPTQLISLMNLLETEHYDLDSLKRIWYASSPMPTEVLRRGLSIFGPIFLQGYGQTESGPEISYLTKETHRRALEDPGEQKILASCGQPCIGVHMRIVDETGGDLEAGEIGEIIIKSDRIMTGYWRKPEETREAIRDGWLYTGDLGYFDEQGFIYIADRKKDMIISGGENVYPKEVEDVLYKHPAIKEAAIIGISDPYWVERVHAMVVLKDGVQVEEEEIITFCKEKIANYKVPKSIEFVKDLPKNPQGKILKKDIRKKY